MLAAPPRRSGASVVLVTTSANDAHASGNDAPTWICRKESASKEALGKTYSLTCLIGCDTIIGEPLVDTSLVTYFAVIGGSTDFRPVSMTLKHDCQITAAAL